MIEVTVNNPANFSVPEAVIEETVARVFLVHDVTEAKVGVWVVDEPEMKRLNEQYKHHAGSTDVLTFPMHDPQQPTPAFVETAETKAEYGDMFLCFPVIESEAAEEGTSIDEKFAFLAEHGALHLLGIHHD